MREDNLHNPVALVSAELQGERVGVNMTPFWLLLSPAGGRVQNQNHIAQGSGQKAAFSRGNELTGAKETLFVQQKAQQHFFLT